MSKNRTDPDNFEYDGDLLDLLEDSPYAEDGDLIFITFTHEELGELGGFLLAMLTMGPSLEQSAPAIVHQVIDFARELEARGE